MRKLIAASAATAGLVLVAPTSVFAQDTDLENSETDAFELSPMAVTIVIGTLIPLLTGLVTKLAASDRVKATVNLLLSALSALLTANLVDGGGAVMSDETLILAGLAFVASVAAYWGFWRPLDINAKLAPNTGIG